MVRDEYSGQRAGEIKKREEPQGLYARGSSRFFTFFLPQRLFRRFP